LGRSSAHIAPKRPVNETFDHIFHVYGRPAEGSMTRLDHELQVGEIIEHDGRSMRVVAARSEDREWGRARIVHLEPISAE
jgi:hypothetical protein